MAVRQYIGARYVPKFFENSATNDSTWAENTPYEPLTIVTWNNFSYTSKVKVPSTVGAPNLNPQYWVLTGDYSGSISAILDRLDGAEGDIDQLEDDVNELQLHGEYFLFPTGDTTDRSADIIAKLTNYGVCYFATGDFYVAHEITMLSNTSLIGMGSKTKLHLAYNGNLIKMHDYCTITNMQLIGQETDIPYESFTKGDRVGIYIDGDATDFDTQTYTRNFGLISNVIIKNFNGSGIKCHRTGGSLNGLEVNNTYILRCHTGIDIDVFSEMNSFSNVSTRFCNIGCVMQAGNNAFNGCTFASCLTLIQVDNTEAHINSDHSTFTGCVIIHAGPNNTGKLLNIKYATGALIFTGCTMYHGEVIIEHSVGVVISNCLLGLPSRTFKLTDCTRCNINGNSFMNTLPTFNLSNSQFSFDNNYGPDGIININPQQGSNSSFNQTASLFINNINLTANNKCVGVCNYANAIDCVLNHQKYFKNTNYTVTVTNCSILSIGSVDPEDVTITKFNGYMMVRVPLTGATPRDCYIIDIGYTITA